MSEVVEFDLAYFGEVWTMTRNMGVYDDRTGLSYSQGNLPDEVAEWLFINKPQYRDRILKISDYENLGKPTYDGLQLLIRLGDYSPDEVEVSNPKKTKK